jgi:hypothetical protein
MDRFSPRLRAFALAILLLAPAACENGGLVHPPAEEPDVGGLWIDGYYQHYAPGSPWAGHDGAIVFVREGSEGGLPVPDVTVRIGESALSYDGSLRAYTSMGLDVTSGDSLTLTVGNSVDAVSAATVIPYPPKDLFLVHGIWDVSEDWIVNTLRWTNPSVLGEQLVAYLYTPVEGEDYLLWYGRTDHPEVNSLSVHNGALPYYSTLTSMTALVCQANYGLFERNPDESAFTVLAGVWGTWQTSEPIILLP